MKYIYWDHPVLLYEKAGCLKIILDALSSLKVT